MFLMYIFALQIPKECLIDMTEADLKTGEDLLGEESITSMPVSTAQNSRQISVEHLFPYFSPDLVSTSALNFRRDGGASWK